MRDLENGRLHSSFCEGWETAEKLSIVNGENGGGGGLTAVIPVFFCFDEEKRPFCHLAHGFLCGISENE